MQAVLGIVVLIAFAWAISEERRKVRTGGDPARPLRHVSHGRGHAQGPLSPTRLRCPEQSRFSPRRIDPSGHVLCFRVPRWRPPPLWRDASRLGLRPRFPGPPHRPGGERPFFPAFLLAHSPCRGEGLRLVVRKDHAGRRRRGSGGFREHLSGHGRIAPLSSGPI